MRGWPGGFLHFLYNFLGLLALGGGSGTQEN